MQIFLFLFTFIFLNLIIYLLEGITPSKEWMQLVENRLDEIYLDGV